MTTLSVDTTVAEIAAELPASTQVFEKYGIDFCCGGRSALAEACRARGLDAAAILEEVQRETGSGAVAAETDWRKAGLTELAEYIVANHHAYLKTQLPRLESMLQKVLAAHSARHADVLAPLAAIFRSMREELDSHLMKEERILFPLIRALESGAGSRGFHCGSVQNPIRVMVMEHDSAGDALARLRHLTSGYTPPADACTTFRTFYAGLAEMEADLHRHIHLENNILFPGAVELEANQ